MVTANSIIASIRKRIDQIDNPLLVAEITNNNDNELCRSWFRNYRSGSEPKGLRLTNTGLVALKSLFATYNFYLGGDYRVTSHHLIFFDRICAMPWHLENQHLTVFDKTFAFRYKMVGDLEKFMSAYTDMTTTFSTDANKKQF